MVGEFKGRVAQTHAWKGNGRRGGWRVEDESEGRVAQTIAWKGNGGVDGNGEVGGGW